MLDPDGPVREGLRALLRTLGLTVRTFDTAAALLAAAESGTIACVVMELDLPDAEGLQVLRRLRERRPPVPVILMASHGDVPTAVAAMKAGAADFVEKPFVDALLVERVHRLALAGGAEQGPEGGREP